MIPEDRFSTTPVRGQTVNPWSRDRKVSYHMGPVQVEDTSQGLLAKLWTLRAEGGAAVLVAEGIDPLVLVDRENHLESVTLSFDQNARPCACFEEQGGGAFLYWYDPIEADMAIAPLAAGTVTPRITLDDARQFNIGNSDIILGYVRDGLVRYRRQRDRFQNEFTPPIGPGGSPASAAVLHHISMNSVHRLEFIVDDEVMP